MKNNKKIKVEIISMVITITIFIIFALNMSSDKNELREKGIELFNNKQYDESINVFNDALKEKQWFSKKIDVDILTYTASCFIKKEEYLKAKEVYDKILIKYNSKYYDKEKLLLLIEISDALYNYQTDKSQEALIVFDKAIKEGYHELNIYASVCCEKLGYYDKMLEYLNNYEIQFGKNDFLNYKYAQYYFYIGDYNNALSNVNNGLINSSSLYLKELKLIEIK